jgi:deazaflavin-dependent oxidoreductase (nitroreductase family)
VPEANDFNTQIISEFRQNGGKVGGPFQGAPMVLLHTTGAKSGAERVNPLVYQRLDDRSIAVFASKGGAPTNPDWYHNVLAHPAVTIEVGEATMTATARVARGEERDRIWAQQKQASPAFAEYEQKTTREIPVVILETP